MFKKILFLLVLIPSSFIFSSLKFNLKPGLDLYSDNIGYSAGLGIYYNFIPNIQTGVDLIFSGQFSSNVSFFTVGGGVNTGYTVNLSDTFSMTPSITLGTEFIQFTGSYSNISRFGFLILPGVSAEYAFTGNISAGLSLGYRMLLISLPVYLYNISAFNISLSLSYTFESEQNTVQEKTLVSDIETIMKDRNLDGSVKMSRNEVKMNLSDVLFERDSDRVGANNVGVIQSIALKVKEYPDMTILIEGHTDNSGTRDYNVNLSLNRAKNVATILTASGVPSSRITYKGIGPDKPIVPNDTEQNRARNRRVEISFQFNK